MESCFESPPAAGRGSRPRRRAAARARERAPPRLNAIIRPRVRAIIEDAVRRGKARADYIVLDAVLLFRYRFRFKIDFAVAVRAPAGKRLERIVKRDGVSRAEARRIMERQRGLERDWKRADAVIDTGAPLADVRREARRLREVILATGCGARR
jgi:dephospho-CoA kinase